MAKKRNSRDIIARGIMRPLTREQSAAITTYLVNRGFWRDHALYRTGIDSMLRASDLVRIRIDEILGPDGRIVDMAEIQMKKTGKMVGFAITSRTKEALEKWLEVREHQSEWLFYGRPWWNPMTDVRYRQIAKGWFRAIGLPIKHYSTHSIRRTKATIMYDETNNLKAVSEMLGHANTRMTERYIGMTRRKALELAAKIDV